MKSKPPPAESITVRPSLKFTKAVDPGIYQALIDLPESVRGEFLHAMISRSALGIPTPLPHGTNIPMRTDVQQSRSPNEPVAQRTALAPLTAPGPPGSALDSKTPPQATALTASLEPGAKQERLPDAGAQEYRGLEALGLHSMDDFRDAFDYSSPSAHQDAGT